MVGLLIPNGRMPFLTPTLDNTDPLFILMITPGFYLRIHDVDVADQDPASGKLKKK